MTNIRNEIDYQYRDPTDIKRKMNGWNKQFYTHTFDNIDKMHQFLEKLKLPQLTQYEVDNWNSPIVN